MSPVTIRGMHGAWQDKSGVLVVTFLFGSCIWLCLSAGAHAVRGVGRKNADVELAQLADMLPAEDHSTNAATPSLEKGGASTAPDPAAARATAEPPEQTEASSPGAPPTAAMRRQERLDSPRLQRLVSHPGSSLEGCGLDTSIGADAGLKIVSCP